MAIDAAAFGQWDQILIETLWPHRNYNNSTFVSTGKQIYVRKYALSENILVMIGRKHPPIEVIFSVTKTYWIGIFRFEIKLNFRRIYDSNKIQAVNLL